MRSVYQRKTKGTSPREITELRHRVEELERIVGDMAEALNFVQDETKAIKRKGFFARLFGL